MKKIEKPNSDSEIESLLREPDVVIFFYMDGCPHCENTKPFWEELIRELPAGMDSAEIESAAVSDTIRKKLGITGYPHFVARKNGKQKVSPGSKTSKKELADSLNITKTGGLRRFAKRRTRRLRSRRLSRRVRKALH
jgi:hypothetical protein